MYFPHTCILSQAAFPASISSYVLYTSPTLVQGFWKSEGLSAFLAQMR